MKTKKSQTLDGDKISVRIGKDMRRRIEKVHAWLSRNDELVKESGVIRTLLHKGLSTAEKEMDRRAG